MICWEANKSSWGLLFLFQQFPVVAVTNYTISVSQNNRDLFILSAFWRPEIWNQGPHRAIFPLDVLGNNPFLVSSGFWYCWYSLICSQISLLCLHIIFSMYLLLCRPILQRYLSSDKGPLKLTHKINHHSYIESFLLHSVGQSSLPSKIQRERIETPFLSESVYLTERQPCPCEMCMTNPTSCPLIWK